MANPNLLSLTTINAINFAIEATTTGATQIASNAASSGKVYYFKNLLISNTDTGSHTVTVNLYPAAALGGTAVPIVSGTVVPANSTLTVAISQTPQALTEDTSIGFTASSANVLNASGVYFVMS